MSKKLNENTVSVNVVNAMDKKTSIRKGVYESLVKSVAESKSIRNISLVADFVGHTDKGVRKSDRGTLSTNNNREEYELIHIYSSNNMKQLFYIYISTKGIQFKVTPKLEKGIEQCCKEYSRNTETKRFSLVTTYGAKIDGAFRLHHEHRCYTVSHKESAKMFNLCYKALSKIDVNNFHKVEDIESLKAETIAIPDTESKVE